MVSSTFSATLDRLEAAIKPDSVAGIGRGKGRVIVEVGDLAALLEAHSYADAAARSAALREAPQAYPPRDEMLAHVANDPGLYAGYRGKRSTGRWIAAAIIATERYVTHPILMELIERNWNHGPDALATALIALKDPGLEDFSPQAVEKWEFVRNTRFPDDERSRRRR